MVHSSTVELTKEDVLNGWTVETLSAYRRERDKVADFVPGNVVTEAKRPKPEIEMQGAGRAYDPFTRAFK